MGEVIQRLNPIVWVFAAITVALVLVQAIGFYRKARDFNEKHKVLTKEEKKMVMKSGIISSFGPAISVLVVAITFMSLFGSGATFIRLGVIGSAQYELMIANVAAEAIGFDLTTQAISESAFTLILFAMALGSAPYFINCFFSLKPLEKTLIANKDNKKSFATLIGGIATVTLISYFGIDNVKKNWLSLISFLAAGITTAILIVIADKTGKRWIREWMMGISLLVAIAVSAILISMGYGA